MGLPVDRQAILLLVVGSRRLVEVRKAGIRAQPVIAFAQLYRGAPQPDLCPLSCIPLGRNEQSCRLGLNSGVQTCWMVITAHLALLNLPRREIYYMAPLNLT